MAKEKNPVDDSKRKDLSELHARQAYLDDKNRPKAVKKRHDKGQRTARENIGDLCDKNSFLEYGSFIVAAQSARKSREELMKETPADGLVAGIGTVNSDLFGKEAAKCVVMSYDYTVLAGTQGAFNHKKTDRMMAVAEAAGKPVVFFVEGGGGRPGDVDFYPVVVGGLDLMTFTEFARLSGKVPRVAIVSGYCFAGNAAIAGCADVIIATENVSMGMGGPAMIEGGGLGKFSPKEIGPTEMLSKNGVIDIVVKDEAEAVEITKKYLSYFQGTKKQWSMDDQAALRDLIPENRKYAYDVMPVIKTLADKDSFLELRAGFAQNMVTALIRVEGKPIGVIANSSRHLGGAIDSDACDKAARFMQLCDAFGVPVLSLCDTPGFMVGPDSEQAAMIRHSSRLFVVGASLTIPILTIVLRKAYGLGAMAMAGGSFRSSFFIVSWPTGEFGAMGLEGAVKLGFKKELDATDNIREKQLLYEKLVKGAYKVGKAINAASKMEFDEVIDPIDSRKWISAALEAIPKKERKNARFIDSW
ncbi:MAG: carboxyl transferase domain-containing protein [Bacteroidota bacterium]